MDSPEKRKIILIEEVLTLRARKEEEMRFYEQQLLILQKKLVEINQEINLTNIIIRIIKSEKASLKGGRYEDNKQLE